MDQSAHAVNLQRALARFDDRWSPRIIAAVNGEEELIFTRPKPAAKKKAG